MYMSIMFSAIPQPSRFIRKILFIYFHNLPPSISFRRMSCLVGCVASTPCCGFHFFMFSFHIPFERFPWDDLLHLSVHFRSRFPQCSLSMVFDRHWSETCTWTLVFFPLTMRSTQYFPIYENQHSINSLWLSQRIVFYMQFLICLSKIP